MQDESVDERTEKDLRVPIADALIVYHQIASFATTQSHDFVSRHPNDLDVLSFGHAQHLKHEVWHLLGSLNLEDLVLLPIQIDLIGILCVAQFAGANLVDRRQALGLIVIEATSAEPFLQALEVDVATGPCTVARGDQRVLHSPWLLFAVRLLFLDLEHLIGIVAEANAARLLFVVLFEGR